MKEVLIFIFLGAFLTNCGKSQKQLNNLDIKVAGGQTPANDSPSAQSTVYIHGCGGVLVAPNLIISAAHCNKTWNTAGNNLRVGFVPSAWLPLNEQNSRLVVARGIHHDYSSTSRSFKGDIAWLRFSGTIPNGYKPVSVLSQNGMRMLERGTSVTLVGYGATAEDSVQYGVRLTADSIFNQYFDLGTHAGLFVTGPTPGRGICKGDSGSPVFVRNRDRWLAIGIANGADEIVARVTNCNAGAGRFAAIGYYQTWIEQQTGVRLTTENDPVIVDPSDNIPETPVVSSSGNLLNISSWTMRLGRVTIVGSVANSSNKKAAKIVLERFLTNGNIVTVVDKKIANGEHFELVADLNMVKQIKLNLFDANGNLIDSIIKLKSDL